TDHASESSLHWTGTPCSAETPVPEGPRHCGQLAACKLREKTTRRSGKKRIGKAPKPGWLSALSLRRRGPGINRRCACEPTGRLLCHVPWHRRGTANRGYAAGSATARLGSL